MSKIRGIVRTARIDHEGSNVILRFMMEGAGRQKIPVEMRGQQILGVLEIGDEVVIDSKRIRDRYGVLRPIRVTNLSTNSVVRIKSPGIISKTGRLISSLTYSIASGVGTAVLVGMIKTKISPSTSTYMYRGGRTPSSGLSGDTVPIILGLVVGALVFLLVFRRQRRS